MKDDVLSASDRDDRHCDLRDSALRLAMKLFRVKHRAVRRREGRLEDGLRSWRASVHKRGELVPYEAARRPRVEAGP